MVNTYNIGREVFPANIIAGAFNFEPGTLFEITDDAVREVPKVQF
jgi:LemA protein